MTSLYDHPWWTTLWIVLISGTVVTLGKLSVLAVCANVKEKK